MNEPRFTPEQIARLAPTGWASYCTGGKYIRAKHVALLERYLMQSAAGTCPRLLISMPPRHGKLIDCDTPIATPQGWRNHGDLMPGDFVFAPSGELVRVLGVTERRLDVTYKVTFNDGSEIIAGQDHDWDVLTDRDCRKVGCELAKNLGLKLSEEASRRYPPHRHEELLETKNLLAGYHRRSPQIPVAAPIEYPYQNLPVDPYLLGVWLGDGHKDQAVITSGKQDVEHFAPLGRARQVRGEPYVAYAIYVKGLMREVKKLGLYKCKHIPEIYLRSSYEQRLALLQGLMDTDGYISESGQAEFCNTNERLANEAYELICSLGYQSSFKTGRATLYGRDISAKYRLLFTPVKERPVFRLKRKADRQVESTKTQATRRTIKSVEQVAPVTMNCIQVEGGRYLAGRSLIATHNSELISKFYPSWLLGIRPDTRVMLASYESTFAASWGRKVRDLLTENGERVFGLRVRNDSKAADNWQIEGHNGGMVSVGAGGPLTGRGTECLLWDDILKNAEEAASKRVKEKLWDWWRSTAYTRLEPGGSSIGVATRWAEDDLIGRIVQDMNSGGERWTVINIPAIAREKDPLGRKPGEALWPERYSIEALETIKQSIGKRTFEALYQGEPSPEEGDHFSKSWFDQRYSVIGGGDETYYSIPGSPPFPRTQLRRFAAVDLAMSQKSSADRTAIAVAGTMHDGRTILLDIVAKRLQGPDIPKVLEDVVKQWNLSQIGVEKNGLGLGVVQECIRRGLPVKPLDADADKIARASYLATMLENGRLVFGKGDQFEEAISEALAFPNGQHDDRVDALAYVARMAKGFGGGDPPKIEYPVKHSPFGDVMPNRPLW